VLLPFDPEIKTHYDRDSHEHMLDAFYTISC